MFSSLFYGTSWSEGFFIIFWTMSYPNNTNNRLYCSFYEQKFTNKIGFGIYHDFRFSGICGNLSQTIACYQTITSIRKRNKFREFRYVKRFSDVKTAHSILKAWSDTAGYQMMPDKCSCFPSYLLCSPDRGYKLSAEQDWQALLICFSVNVNSS